MALSGRDSLPLQFPSLCSFIPNRILNPALALVEMVVNGYVLFINRKRIRNIVVARGANPDRPPYRCRNRQLHFLSRPSVLGQDCDLRHAVATNSAPSRHSSLAIRSVLTKYLHSLSGLPSLSQTTPTAERAEPIWDATLRPWLNQLNMYG